MISWNPCSETLLRKLDQLSLVARHARAGQTAGERRSTKRGASVEFADYRDYAKGDDLRSVDWNIYARLDRPYIKLFEEEEDLAVHILLDGSGSMDWGEEGNKGAGEQGSGGAEENKWLYARRLAAALGYVALTSGDRLTVANLQSPGEKPGFSVSGATKPGFWQFGPVRGRGHTLRLFEWLEGLSAEGATDLNAALRSYTVASGRPGLVVLISDLFSPAGYVEGLTALAARGHEVALLHALSPDEIEPPLGGDLRLLDVETGDPQEVTIDGGMRTLYRRRLAAWRDEIQATCRARDVYYMSVETDTPFERVVLYELRRVGLVR
ncbi:MAG: DUF58 domain-containing protein [Chloroflexota bacterium]|nr:DUF58 domain-containing protein [Chloroflexota bacterium]